MHVLEYVLEYCNIAIASSILGSTHASTEMCVTTLEYITEKH